MGRRSRNQQDTLKIGCLPISWQTDERRAFIVEYYHKTQLESVINTKAIEGICGELSGNGELSVNELSDKLEYLFQKYANRTICFIGRLQGYGRFFPQIDSNKESDGEKEILCAIFYEEKNVPWDTEIYVQQMGRAIILGLLPDDRRRKIPPDITLDRFKAFYPYEYMLMDRVVKVLIDSVKHIGGILNEGGNEL